MENLLILEKQEKIIADLLGIKKELDGRRESILDNGVMMLFGNPVGVLGEALNEFSEKYAQFRYKVSHYLAELDLSREEMLQLSNLLVLKEQKLKHGALLHNLGLLSSTWVTFILVILVFFFVKDLILGILLFLTIWYVQNKITDLKAEIIHQARDYRFLNIYLEDRLKANS